MSNDLKYNNVSIFLPTLKKEDCVKLCKLV